MLMVETNHTMTTMTSAGVWALVRANTSAASPLVKTTAGSPTDNLAAILVMLGSAATLDVCFSCDLCIMFDSLLYMTAVSLFLNCMSVSH